MKIAADLERIPTVTMNLILIRYLCVLMARNAKKISNVFPLFGFEATWNGRLIDRSPAVPPTFKAGRPASFQQGPVPLISALRATACDLFLEECSWAAATPILIDANLCSPSTSR